MEESIRREIPKLKKIATNWGCTCRINKRKKLPEEAGTVIGFLEEAKNNITIYYTEEATLWDLKHVFFHELGHKWYYMLECLSEEDHSLPDMEKAAENYAYHLYKNYFPEECPHHAKFAMYRGKDSEYLYDFRDSMDKELRT